MNGPREPGSFVPAPPLPDWLAAELPFERGAYRLASGSGAGLDRGSRLHFIDQPASDPTAELKTAPPPVLFLHGNPTWSFLWRKVIQRLPGRRRVAPDLLGLGLSDKPRRLADHTVERHAAAVAELVEALGLREMVLVAQDWGGPIAALVGAMLPDRVAGLVLANTAVILPDHLHGTAFHRFARRPLVSDLAFRLLGFPQRALHKVQGDPGSIRGTVARAYRWPLRKIRDRAAPLAMARMVPDRPEHPSVPALRRGEQWVRGFSGPIALVWGTRDPILGRTLGRHEEALPQATVTRTDAGHFLQEEVPSELAEAVREVGLRV